MQKQTSAAIVSQPILRHRRQTAWQILFPFLLVAAGVITLLVLVLAGNSASGSLDHLTNISILWLVIPAILFAVFLLIFLIVAIVLVAKITTRVPLAGLKISTFVYQAAIMIHKVADSAAAPTIKFEEILAGLRALFHRN